MEPIVNSNAGSIAWVTLVTGHGCLERRNTGGFGNPGIGRLPATGRQRESRGPPAWGPRRLPDGWPWQARKAGEIRHGRSNQYQWPARGGH